MVWTCKIVPQRLGGILPKEDRSGITDFCHHGKGILRQDFQMLRSNLIGGVRCLIQRIYQQNIAIIVEGFSMISRLDRFATNLSTSTET